MKEYRDIKGYEGKYQVSNDGEVIALNFHNQKFSKVLNQDFDKYTDGYKRVTLYKNGKRKRYSVHRLVCEAFIPNPENKPYVNHIDSNRTNNKISNLEWCTPLENTKHAKTNSFDYRKRFKKVKVIETGVIYNSISECSRILGIERANIHICLKNPERTAKKLHFIEG